MEQITTPEAMDALPEGKAVTDRHGDVWRRTARPGQWWTPETAPFSAAHIVKKWGPLRVIADDTPAPRLPSDEVASMRERHQACTCAWRTYVHCHGCAMAAPCDTARLLTLMDAPAPTEPNCGENAQTCCARPTSKDINDA